ncbi:MAG: hypothetical protein SynsKO_44770 [Synoicihabitans sp.]
MASGSSLTDYPAVQDYLFGLKAKGVKFGIDRMRNLAAAIGHPERTLPIVHIAGTNGKGSTAAMVESILRAAGKRVGLYTSPHLVRLGERVQVDRIPLSDADIVAYTRELLPIAEELSKLGPDEHPSFFEFMTAMAFLQFAREDCDAGVVEVGLGGELDATNVVQPSVTAITSIALDHCDILGNTLQEIARAKAGIIKPDIPLVLGKVPKAAEDVIREIAAERRSPVFSVETAFGSDLNSYPDVALEGDCQRVNAATASLIVGQGFPEIDSSTIRQGLNAAHWPARWESLQVADRHLILDTSHNPEGALELASNLTRLVAESARKPLIVVGALGVSRAGPLLEAVAAGARELHVVVPAQARSCSHEELRNLIPESFSGPIHLSSVHQLFGSSNWETWSVPGDTIVVTGSIYLAGEVLSRLPITHDRLESHLQDF